MGNIGKVALKIFIVALFWIAFAFVMPIVKTFYDSFTAPITGALIANADEWTLALVTGLPWILPVIAFVISIVYIVSPDTDKKDDTQDGNIPYFRR